MLRRFGWNATAFQVLEKGFRYWMDPEGDACVAYVDTGGAWVAAGAPVASGNSLHSTAERFIQSARAKGRRACFFAVEERFIALPIVSSMPIGEQPSWNPAKWAETIRASRGLREQLRRARAKGVTTRVAAVDEIDSVDSPTRRAIETLVQRWLASRKMAPMGFLVGVEPFDFPKERRYILAEKNGQLVGALIAVPVYGRRGWLFEDILRDPDAPNGTPELMIDEAMRLVAVEGSRYVTLGLAPLAGDVAPWLRIARAVSSLFYDFDGVRRFKARLHPNEWAPIHLAWPRGESGNRALGDALLAFTDRAAPDGGIGRVGPSFARFGLETIVRSPAFAVRVLAALLIPWTALLWLADPTRWFPSPSVKVAWVAFDVILAFALFALARRWRHWLAKALLVATATDAVLTIFEAIAFNVPRMHSTLDALVTAIACLGPALATLLLWAALHNEFRPAN